MTFSLLIFVAILLIWSVFRALLGDESVFILGLSYLGVWLFSPLLVLVPWVFLDRHKLGAILLVIPVGLFLWFYGPLLLPKRTHAGDLIQPLTALTFNVRYDNTDFKALLAAVDRYQTDVLAFQEFASHHDEHLSTSLSDRYPYRWYYAPAGLAIYSAHPISAQEIYPAQPWPVQSAIIQVQDRPFHLVNAHLAPPGIFPFLATLDPGRVRDLAAARVSQIGQIQHATAKVGLPTIVACDCNITNLTTAYAKMTANLRDAFKERGWGLGHTLLIPRGLELRSPINLPVQRIDYLFYSSGIKLAKVQVISGDSGSDHRPLWALFDLAG